MIYIYIFKAISLIQSIKFGNHKMKQSTFFSVKAPVIAKKDCKTNC